MIKSKLEKAYKDYLKETVDFNEKRLSIEEYIEPLGVSSYGLVNSSGELGYQGLYEEIVDLGINGYLCIHSSNMYDKLTHVSPEGEKLSSSDLFSGYELFDQYFRACNPETHVGDEYFDYKRGQFFVPYCSNAQLEFEYERDAEILLAKITHEGIVHYSYFRRDIPGFCFDSASFEFATPFRNGIATVKNDGVYYAIDESGNKLFDKTFVFLGTFDEGLAPFSDDGKSFGYIDTEGNVVIEPKFKGALNFRDGVARVSAVKLFKATDQTIDLNGNVVKTQEVNGFKMIVDNGSYRFYDKYTGDYISVMNPVVANYEGFLLCKSAQGIEVFDKKSGVTNLLVSGDINVENIQCLDRLLVVGDRHFYLDSKNGKIVDLTGYVDLSQIYGIGDFFDGKYQLSTFEEFKNLECYRENKEAEHARSEMLRQTEERKSGVTSAKTIHERIFEERRQIEAERADTLEQLKALKEKLSYLEKKGYSEVRIDSDILFDEVDDHREIKPELLDDLPFLDLAAIDFSGVKVSGLNLSNTNIAIDPQTVYRKDMSNGIYDGIRLISRNFDGVNVNNSSFEGCDVNFDEFDDTEVLEVDDLFDGEDVEQLCDERRPISL